MLLAAVFVHSVEASVARRSQRLVVADEETFVKVEELTCGEDVVD
jgi:hypothetical protein